MIYTSLSIKVPLSLKLIFSVVEFVVKKNIKTELIYPSLGYYFLVFLCTAFVYALVP